ncbi:MAG: hypothetical protein JST75_15940 [Bacteroidetes bacterium]|nr:hypothetical protein [Bacteroidota bacterium]
MKTSEMKMMMLDELNFEESTKIDGGQSLLYYVAYDIGFLTGTVAKVAQKVVESVYYGSVTTFLK